MKKCISMLLALLLLTAAGCQSGQDQVYQQAMKGPESSASSQKQEDGLLPPTCSENTSGLSPAAGDDLSGELTIKSFGWGSPSSIVLFSQEFRKLHPNVKFQYDYDMDGLERIKLTKAEIAQREKSYDTKLRVELASGEADYLLYNASERMDTYQMSHNGLLLDLRPYWENDPDMDPDNYYREILDAFSADGKMTVIPLSCMFHGAFFNRAVLEKLGVDPESLFAVDSDDILGWYEQARETDPELQLFFSAPGKDTLFPYESPRYMDLGAGTASFRSPSFLTFLERTNAALNDDPELDPEEEIGASYGALADERLRFEETGKPPVSVVKYEGEPPSAVYNVATKGRISFATVEEMGDYEMVNTQQPLEYMAGPYPLTSTDGKLGLTSRGDFAVPASCKNPELAWEFIKYCISNREDLTFADLGYDQVTATGIFSPNKKLSVMAAEHMPQETSGYMPGYAQIDPVDGAGMQETVERILTLDPVNANQYRVDVQEFLEEYYVSGLTTAEECAEKIQGRTEIWLRE